MKKPGKRRFRGLMKTQTMQYILAVACIGGTALLCSPLANTESYHVVSFILLFVVSILSTFVGIWPILMASALGALLWNYYFIPPHHTFNIGKTEDLLIFGLFFIIALVSGVLTTRVRRQEEIASEREKRTNALFQLTRELSKANGIEVVLRIAKEEIRNQFKLEALFMLQDGNHKLITEDPVTRTPKLDPIESEVAAWVFVNQKKAGAGTDHFPEIEYTLFPLRGTRLNPGVIAVRQSGWTLLSQSSYWDTYTTQISNALEREFLGELAQKVRFLAESDRLYKTLFNSISHELRIPVATIMGASDSIIHSSNPEPVQRALCHEIFTASLRLNRLIENLLSMSRLESGLISVRIDWCDITDLVNKVIQNLSDELKPFSLTVHIPGDMPLVKIDFGLMEQVLYNLVINATQHAPATSEIILKVEHLGDSFRIELLDRGPGFPRNEISNVFNKFFRVEGSKSGGLGLGLSIAKGFVEAHSGRITVENTKTGGARFVLHIPTEKPNIETCQEEES